MKCSKRCALLALTAALAAALLAAPAAAYQPRHTASYTESGVFTAGLNNSPEDQAALLQALGLFRGTDEGLRLDAPLTRAQAAVMLTRLFGQESAVLAEPPRHPFRDVPAWADPYVGYLYENGLSNGVSSDRYDAARPIRYTEYAAMLARALRGPGTPYGDWVLVGRQEEDDYLAQFPAFPRGSAVALTVRALLMETDGETLLQKLCGQGVFSAEALRDASYGVLPATYTVDGDGVLRRYVGGVAVARCPVTGLTLAENSLTPDQDQLYAARREHGRLTVYGLDCRTLAVRRQAQAPSPDAVGVSQAGLDGESPYLMELLPGQPGPVYGAALRWVGDDLQTCWTAQDLWNGEAVAADGGLVQTEEGRLLVRGGGMLRIWGDGAAISVPWADGSELLYYDGDDLVGTRRAADGTLTLFLLDAATGETRQSLDVPPRASDAAPLSLRRDGWFFVGSAGAFSFQNGTLTQILDVPTLQVVLTRNLFPYFLTYTPGVSPRHDGAQTGDGVYTLDGDGAPSPVLSAECGHGIRFLALTDYDKATGVAPGGAVLTYLIGNHSLDVLAALNPDASPAVVQAEHARLAALGLCT